jgi:hypothetical protein
MRRERAATFDYRTVEELPTALPTAFARVFAVWVSETADHLDGYRRNKRAAAFLTGTAGRQYLGDDRLFLRRGSSGGMVAWIWQQQPPWVEPPGPARNSGRRPTI